MPFRRNGNYREFVVNLAVDWEGLAGVGVREAGAVGRLCEEVGVVGSRSVLLRSSGYTPILRDSSS